jgi:hypothetical protein
VLFEVPMDVRQRCWFRGCLWAGEPRPLFAHSHELPATLRLCQAHMSVVDARPALLLTEVARPARTPAELQ